MNILKNMEVIFAVSAGLVCSLSYLSDNLPQAQANANVASAAAQDDTLSTAIVVIPGKRMSEAEKQQSLAEERQGAKSGARSTM